MLFFLHLFSSSIQLFRLWVFITKYYKKLPLCPSHIWVQLQPQRSLLMLFVPPSTTNDHCARKFVNWWMNCSPSPTTVLICGQIQQWEQNLERFNMDLFRMRCYLASLQGSELPNPKSLLATASRPTKAALARLGIFSVSSFHALVSSLEHHSYSPLFFFLVLRKLIFSMKISQMNHNFANFVLKQCHWKTKVHML